MTKVNEVMTKKLHIIDPDDNLQSAAILMKQHGIGFLPVITKQGETLGTITDRDIAVRGVAEGRAPNDTRVREAMTDGVEFCYDDDSIDRLAEHMGEKQLRRLLVVDRSSKGIKGIVSIGDLARRGENKDMAGKTLAFVATS